MSEDLMKVLFELGLLVFVILFFIFVMFVLFIFFNDESYLYVPDLINDFIEKHFGDKTNGDRIRSMTDQELAVFLYGGDSFSCIHCEHHGNDDDKEACHVCTREFEIDILRKWLAADQDVEVIKGE